ncbi:DgyrCDS5793 [Dimorphilus gyrociliatus]|uniref:DgyrCDS5793 n=1 Tax=Dimorphilus gyrociliatus TaxID=2664684 RepID=A0A7I8VNN5_9ANNE|nr:DgyrCDS5793 [Dimorphilus gyrociliatus]
MIQIKLVSNATLPLRNGKQWTSPILFNCTSDGNNEFDDDEITWLRNGKKIDFKKETDYARDNKKGQFKIKFVRIDEDSGNFTCRIKSDDEKNEDTILIESEPQVSFKEERSKNLVQGDPLILKCRVYGRPSPDSVTWYNPAGEILSNEFNSRVVLSANEGIENATLKIKDMDFDDKGTYTCEATNIYGTHNSTITVRVKDKLAALWPFLGICGEVLILCTIIFIYERSRKKKNAKEAEAVDEAADKLTNSNDHHIRQRKT